MGTCSSQPAVDSEVSAGANASGSAARDPQEGAQPESTSTESPQTESKKADDSERSEDNQTSPTPSATGAPRNEDEHAGESQDKAADDRGPTAAGAGPAEPDTTGAAHDTQDAPAVSGAEAVDSTSSDPKNVANDSQGEPTASEADTPQDTTPGDTTSDNLPFFPVSGVSVTPVAGLIQPQQTGQVLDTYVVVDVSSNPGPSDSKIGENGTVILKDGRLLGRRVTRTVTQRNNPSWNEQLKFDFQSEVIEFVAAGNRVFVTTSVFSREASAESSDSLHDPSKAGSSVIYVTLFC